MTTKWLALLGCVTMLAGCAHAPAPPVPGQVLLPVLQGWFDGEAVLYVTTDVSHADVAADKGANFAPRLADALPGGPPQPGRRSSVDKVYAVTNFKQPSVFASAPRPVGPASTDTSYSPLWQMVKVIWVAGKNQQTLKSEEAVGSGRQWCGDAGGDQGGSELPRRPSRAQGCPAWRLAGSAASLSPSPAIAIGRAEPTSGPDS
jgi:hypothetical protein